MRINLVSLLAFGCLLACSPSPREFQEVGLAALGSGPSGAEGSVRLPRSARGATDVSVRLEGLEPETLYVLCVDPGRPDSATSDHLAQLEVSGWPLGELYVSPAGQRVGHWNFATVQTDSEGSFDGAFELPLPPYDYRVRLLVKTVFAAGSVPVLQSKGFSLAVSPTWFERWLAGTVVALAVAPLVWIARARRRRSSEPEPEPELDGEPRRSAATAPELSRLERARADGVLRHAKSYSWIEIHGQRKSFRPRQARVFQILCEQDPGCDGLPQEEIVRAWEETFPAKRANPVRVRDIFRACPGEPGNFLVRVPGPASVYRLRLEPETEVASSDPGPRERVERRVGISEPLAVASNSLDGKIH